jgi:hypothetical protein
MKQVNLPNNAIFSVIFRKKLNLTSFSVYLPNVSLSCKKEKIVKKVPIITEKFEGLYMEAVSGSGMFIPDPRSEFFPSRIQVPGQKDSGSRIRIRIEGF